MINKKKITVASLFKIFKRETSSGRYIPQLDGLRFIAITSVLLYHANGLLQRRWLHLSSSSTSALNIFNSVLSLGSFGVPVFFCISGYILTQPLWNAENFSYKKYITRRVSRIEPPFFITCVVFGIGVWFHHEMNKAEFSKEFFSTLFYLHNLFIPAYNSKINGVTWSLEIEVQFYLIIPFLILYIKNKNSITFILCSILFFYVYNLLFPDKYKFLNDYINYFSIGILISYIKEKSHFRKNLFYFPGMNMLLVCLAFYFEYLTDNGYEVFRFLNYFIFFLLFYNVLVKANGIRFLSSRLISDIGGMCYTIYLLHFPIITFLANQFAKKIPHNFTSYLFALISISLTAIIICACFFLIIEKPFMKKGWYLKSKEKLITTTT